MMSLILLAISLKIFLDLVAGAGERPAGPGVDLICGLIWKSISWKRVLVWRSRFKFPSTLLAPHVTAMDLKKGLNPKYVPNAVDMGQCATLRDFLRSVRHVPNVQGPDLS